jgi:hypothetical protein
MHAAVSRRFGLSKSLGLDCAENGLGRVPRGSGNAAQRGAMAAAAQRASARGVTLSVTHF